MTPRRGAGHWPREKILDLHLRVSGCLRGGGAPGSAKVQGARHAQAPNPLVQTQNVADRRAESTAATVGGGTTRCHAGRTRCALGSALSHFDHGSVAGASWH